MDWRVGFCAPGYGLYNTAFSFSGYMVGVMVDFIMRLGIRVTGKLLFIVYGTSLRIKGIHKHSTTPFGGEAHAPPMRLYFIAIGPTCSADVRRSLSINTIHEVRKAHHQLGTHHLFMFFPSSFEMHCNICQAG